MATVFTACGSKDEDTTKTTEVPTAFQGKLLEPYIKYIVSGNYTYEATQEDGVPVTYAKAGDDKILLTTSVTEDDQSVTLTLMYVNGKYYIVLPSSKTYAEATSDQVKDYNIKNLFSALNLDNFTNSSFVASGKTTYKKTEYQYEDYYNALSQITNRFFFDADGNLKMVGNVKNDTVKSPNTISIYETNDSTFDILSNYTLVEQESTTATTTSKSNSADVLN